MDFLEIPAMWFVVATLLPLASFLLLLLTGALRLAVRPRNGASGNALYQLLGGGTPVRAGAFVATGAMAGAFVLCLIGSLQFLREYHQLHHGETHAAAGSHDADAERAKFDARWSGGWTWAYISPSGLSTPDNPLPDATRLEIGYHIDHLAVAMFLMVTFIATLIHLFSIGYMADELQLVVEDHQVHTAHGHFQRRGRFGRFFMFLSLFCFSMLNLILADNLFQVFVSWELVGICSYLLDRLLLRTQERIERRQQGVHHQPRRRRRLHPRPADPLDVPWARSTSRRFSSESERRRRTRTTSGSLSARRLFARRKSARRKRIGHFRWPRMMATPWCSCRTTFTPMSLPKSRANHQRPTRSTSRMMRRQATIGPCPTGCSSPRGWASSSAASASRRSFRCTSGCRTPWKGRRRSARSSTRPRWWPPASTSSAGYSRCSRRRRCWSSPTPAASRCSSRRPSPS